MPPIVYRRGVTPLLVLLLAGYAALISVAGPARAEGQVVCTLRVPANPTSAQGLATPYRLGNGCDEANPDESAFVEAAVLDPAGKVSIYHPLVVTAGDDPAAAPVTPAIAAGSTVGIWFGFNGQTLILTGPGSAQAVNGLGRNDPFGQFGYINAPALFTAATAAITAGKLTVPPLGTAADGGEACPTTRHFGVVDQDQSDNLNTTYWVTRDGLISQVAAPNSMTISNGSDEGLLAKFIDPALGCTPWKLPSLDTPGAMVPSLAANELQAAARQAAPVALVPTSDPMTLHNGRPNPGKTSMYRAGVDQPPINPATETPAAYCANLRAVAPGFLTAHRAAFAGAPGPGGADLFPFLTARLQASLTALGCTGNPFGHGRKGRMDGPPVVPPASAVPPAPAAGHDTTGVVDAADAATAAPTTWGHAVVRWVRHQFGR